MALRIAAERTLDAHLPPMTCTTDIRRIIEGRHGLPKRKIKDGDTRPRKLNLKPPISDCSGLSDQTEPPATAHIAPKGC